MADVSLNERGKVPGPGRYRTVGGGTVLLRYYNPISNIAAPWGGTYWEPDRSSSRWHSWDEEGRSVSGHEQMNLVLPEEDPERAQRYVTMHEDGTIATLHSSLESAQAQGPGVRIVRMVELRDDERIFRPQYRQAPASPPQAGLRITSSKHGSDSDFQRSR